MGHLRDGEWNNDAVATINDEGKYDREKSVFRETISKDHKTFKPEKHRYHLYVSYACPWAHRNLITRQLKDLEPYITVDVVHPHMLEHSWTFDKDYPGSTGDTLYGLDYLYQIYQKHDSKVNTKVTVPVLWDKKEEKIVNNESSEIIRIFNSAFNELTNNDLDLYPSRFQSEIDEVNKMTYEPINNGVYKAGFAKNQKAYEEALGELFDQLDRIDKRLENSSFLVGDQLTEADIRLVTTLIRFDNVYYTHFKCNKKHIYEYKNLGRYLKTLYTNYQAIKDSTHLNHIKEHYFYSHDFINPNRIIPPGPELGFMRKD